MQIKHLLRIFILILTLALVLPLFACNNDNTPHVDPESSAADESVENITDESDENVTDESQAYESSEQPTETDDPQSEFETYIETESDTFTESVTEGESETETESKCQHEYAYECTDECLLCGKLRDDPADHSFGSDSKCDTLTCENCGLVLTQDHDWYLTSDGTATLLSAGTMIHKCDKCNGTRTEELTTPIDPSELGMPIVYITDIEGEKKPLADLQKSDGEIIVKYKYVSNSDDIDSFECVCEIKIQGASSAGYVKKNFTVKFFTDETLEKKNKVDLGWGKENKYCMKANYIDSTQARNIVGAQMFAQMVESRDNIIEGLTNAPNYGLIDGYPILVYINGEYHGIYTMNIPKDNWQFAMEGEEEAREALLMADAWTKSVSLNESIGIFSSGATWETYGWEVEHCSTNDETWIRDSFNRLIEILNCGNEDRIRSELPKHLDIEAAIDNMVFTYFINAKDNRSKNILWATYDGNIWIPSMYDMDGTFGNYWNGQPIETYKEDGFPENATDTYPYFDSKGNMKEIGNQMWKILMIYFPKEVIARYSKLRESILTVENTQATFERFFAKTHELAYISDVEKWDVESNKNKLSYTYGHITRTNMYSTTASQLEHMDVFFYNLVDTPE